MDEVVGATSEAVSVNVTTTPFELVVSNWGVVEGTGVVVIGVVVAGADVVVLGEVVGTTEATEDVEDVVEVVVVVEVVGIVDDTDTLVGVVAVVLQSHEINGLIFSDITQTKGTHELVVDVVFAGILDPVTTGPVDEKWD